MTTRRKISLAAMITSTIAVLGVAGYLWVQWPVWTMRNFERAIRRGDWGEVRATIGETVSEFDQSRPPEETEVHLWERRASDYAQSKLIALVVASYPDTVHMGGKEVDVLEHIILNCWVERDQIVAELNNDFYGTSCR